MNPIVRSLPDCCAPAASGHAAEERDELAPSHESSPESQDHAKVSREDTTGVTARQGIKTQSKGWTMTASG
jgi:hypothetical protein